MNQLNKKKFVKKILKVRINQIGKTKYEFSIPVNKKYLRPRGDFANHKAAENHAMNLYNEYYDENGNLRDEYKPEYSDCNITIKEALEKTIRESDCNRNTKLEYQKYANCFLKYIHEKHNQKITLWRELTSDIINEYKRFLEKKGNKYDTIRLRLSIIRKTAISYANERPDIFKNIFKTVKLKNNTPANSEIKAEEKIFQEKQFFEILNYLKKESPMVYIWALCSGLMGMRVLESVYLRIQDIDFKKKTITITESSAHKPKTRSSFRELPAPKIVMDALKNWIDKYNDKHKEGFIFLPSQSERINSKVSDDKNKVYTIGAISRKCSRALKSAKRNGIFIPSSFIFRNFRSNFCTLMSDKNVSYPVIQRYVGHEPNSILGKHYDNKTVDKLRKIPNLIDELIRKHNTASNDQKIQRDIPASISIPA